MISSTSPYSNSSSSTSSSSTSSSSTSSSSTSSSSTSSSSTSSSSTSSSSTLSLPAHSGGRSHVYQEISFETAFPRVFRQIQGTDEEGMRSVEEIFHRILTPLYGSQKRAIQQIREGKDRHCYLLYENELPVGVLVFKTVLSNEFAEFGITDSIEIKSLFVDNSVKNSGRGLGSTLVDKLKEEVNKLALGHKGIHVTVSETKQESLLFFRKKDFNIVHAWKDRYIPGVTEYLLSCPKESSRIETGASGPVADSQSIRESVDGSIPELLHVIHHAHFDDIHSFKKLSDGTFISGSKDNCIYKWNSNGELVSIIQDVEPRQIDDRDWITALQVVNDKYWISGLRNGKVALWKTNGEFVKLLNVKLPSRFDHISMEQNTRRVNCLATGLEYDKPSVFVGFPTMFDEYNLIEGRTESSTKVHVNDWVYCIHPLDEQRILTVTGCTVDLWKKVASSWEHGDTVLAEGKPKFVKIGGKTRKQRTFISSLTPLQGGEAPNLFGLAVFDGSVKVIDIVTKNIVRSWMEHKDRVWTVENLDGARFVSSGEDRTVKIWDIRAPSSAHTIKDHIGQVTSLLHLNEHTLLAGTCPERGVVSRLGAEIRFYDLRRCSR